MRKALITAVALGAALTLPAAAFADHNNSRGNSRGQYRCNSDSDDQVVGALIGGVLGGLLGSEIAGYGDRTEGAVAGAVLGGVLGAVVTDGKDCNRGRKARNGKRKYRKNTGYNNTGYGYEQNGYGNNEPYANQNRRYRKNERRARRNGRRYDQRDNQRSSFWNEQPEGGYQKEKIYNAGYNTGSYAGEKCRYRNVKVRYNDGSKKKVRVKECRGVNGNWARQ